LSDMCNASSVFVESEQCYLRNHNLKLN